MKNVLRALVLTLMLGAASMASQAQVRVFFGAGTPVAAYVPPSPGVNFIWAPGYYYGQVWVPGRWVDRDDYYRGGYYGYRGGYYGRADRDDFYRHDWDRNRGWDRHDRAYRDHGDRDRGWGHGH